jgi:hypothetical protein
MTIEFAAATFCGIGTGPAPIINNGSSGKICSKGTIFGGERDSLMKFDVLFAFNNFK